MRDVLTEMTRSVDAGDTVALATVVRTFDSAPRAAGASMLVNAAGEVSGSVSGGCVESAVYELSTEVTRSGQPVLVRYGIADDDAFSVGLTCGGVLDVFVESVSRAAFPELDAVRRDIDHSRPVAIATVIEHADAGRLGRRLVVRPHELAGDLGSDRANQAVGDDARGLLASGRAAVLTYGPDGERRGEGMSVFVNTFAPRPRMLIFGSIDFAAALSRLASYLGYRVTVCDARSVFTTQERFPDAEVVVSWPHTYLTEQLASGLVDERTTVCVLTHDPKFDVPLLEVALRSERLAYVGAMGSRRTHLDRIRRLRAAGVGEEALARLHSPIGLDLGSRTPEETAVSITAEIIAERWGGSGGALGSLSDRIHHDDPPPGTAVSQVSGTEARG